MQGDFSLPSVDHLIEGVHYKIINWNFADSSPASQPAPGESCPPGTKMVFGMCRKLKSNTQDWDPEQESDQEKAGKAEAQKAGSSFENNKPVSVGGKKYGWAKKGGKPVLVEWGSVAGAGKAQTPTPGAPATPGAGSTPAAAGATPSAK